MQNTNNEKNKSTSFQRALLTAFKARKLLHLDFLARPVSTFNGNYCSLEYWRGTRGCSCCSHLLLLYTWVQPRTPEPLNPWTPYRTRIRTIPNGARVMCTYRMPHRPLLLLFFWRSQYFNILPAASTTRQLLLFN